MHDASLLLYEVMRQPLDPGYEMAARSRDGRRRISGSLLAGILGAGLALGTVVAVRDLRAPEPEALSARRALEEQIDGRTAAVRRREEINADLRERIAWRQNHALNRQGAADLALRVERMGVAAGELPVEGPGLELVLDDSYAIGDPAMGDDPRDAVALEESRVHDRDLQMVVNGLWAAGAEAISVNGQRLTALSAIRSAGEAILVDFRPLVPPYVIRCIGDPAQMQAGFAADPAGPYLQSLRDNYGVNSTMASRDRIRLPGAGKLALRWARSDEHSATLPGGDESMNSTGTGVEVSP